MQKLSIKCSESYDMYVGSGILCRLPDLIKEALPSCKRFFVVTDDVVSALHMRALEDVLSGFYVNVFTFANGEASKTHLTLLKIYDELSREHFNRNDCIIGFGGGVVGDIAAFAAATYNRGMRLIQLPTTLLSATDSSIGGKAAVNLPSGKNLVGTFKQPSLVVCDTALLSTLPPRQYNNGMAEVIKSALLEDAELLSTLLKGSHKIDELIYRSCAVKRHYVELDEYDLGERRVLNFGHTIGHALEAYSGYTMLHGECVAIGMLAATRLGIAMGITSPQLYDTLSELLGKSELPHSIEKFEDDIFNALSLIKNDKKSHGDGVDMVFLSAPGHPIIKYIGFDELADLI